MTRRGRVVHGRSVRRLCAAIVACGGLVCLAVAFWLVAAEEEVAGWPTVPGVVTAQRTDLVEAPGPRRRGPRFRVTVRYRYEVDGRAYESDRFNAAGGEVDRDTAEAVRDRYPPGAACEVYHDPADPALAYLVVGTGPAGWVVIWSLTAVGVLQLGLAGWGVWSRRSGGRAG